MQAAKRPDYGLQWLGWRPEDLWGEELPDVARQLFTTRDAGYMLHVSEKTLRLWAAAAGITPPGDPAYPKSSGWTMGNLKHLADLHHRKLGEPPAEPEPSRRVRELEARVELIERVLRENGIVLTAKGQVAPPEPPVDITHQSRTFAPRRTVRTVPLQRDQKGTIPEGWAAPRSWAKQHGVPATTVENMIARGDLPLPLKGRWTVPHKKGTGATLANSAWNEAQQEEVVAILRRVGYLREEV